MLLSPVAPPGSLCTSHLALSPEADPTDQSNGPLPSALLPVGSANGGTGGACREGEREVGS